MQPRAESRLPIFKPASRGTRFAAPRLRIALQVLALFLVTLFARSSLAQSQLTFAALSVAETGGVPAGQINALGVDGQGNLIFVLDQGDGIRVLKTDAATQTVLAQAHLGAKGDEGLALALDPNGNVYVTGTTSSGSLETTAGAVFPSSASTGTYSFVARFDTSLNPVFVSFTGASPMQATAVAATADSVFVTGSIFSATLPATSSAALSAPASGTIQNGFVERFTADGKTLQYATYLSGSGGITSPAALAVDAAGEAYVAGYTSAPGLPTTTSAPVPVMIGSTSGFVTRLTAAGDAFSLSTFVPGGGITSLAIDPATQTLWLSGMISLGGFPVATAQGPLAPLPYQVLVHMPLDLSSVLSSTALAPGTHSLVALDGSGGAWTDGDVSTPLLPGSSPSSFGDSFALHVNAAGTVDQAARFGGLPITGGPNSVAPVILNGLAVDASGNALVAGAFAPQSSSSTTAHLTFDLPLSGSPTIAFSASAHDALLPASSCTGSLCAGSAAYLARLAGALAAPAPALALAVDDAPNLTVRNLGSAQADGLQITVSGFSENDDCGTALNAAAECSVLLTGKGPGSITVSAQNAATETLVIPAPAAAAVAEPVVFSPKEIDFGISSSAAPISHTVTVTNISAQAQTFASAWIANPILDLPYSVAESATDCTLAGGNTRTLLPGASCHITLTFTASSNSANDGAVRSGWMIGSRMVHLAAYGQAVGLSVSASAVSFGTQYVGGVRLPRYLYLSNFSASTYTHHAVSIAAASPFTAEDECPSALPPQFTCRIRLDYNSTQPSTSDVLTLELDQGLSILVTGQTNPARIATAPAEPVLALSTTSIAFSNPVLIGATSSETQSLSVTNTGTASAQLSFALTGSDFSDASDCGNVLAPGAKCTVSFSFTPFAAGVRQGTFTVNGSSGSSTLSVALSGTGSAAPAPIAKLVASPTSVDFGSVIVGTQNTLPLVLANTGAAAVSNMSVSASTGFSVDAGCGSELVPGASCTVHVTFAPGESASVTGFVSIAGSGLPAPVTIPLSAAGVPAPTFSLTTAAGSTLAATVSAGKTATAMLTLAPVAGFSGNIAVSCTPVTPGDRNSCSAAPSQLQLNNSAPQNATVTVTTAESVTAAAGRDPAHPHSFAQTSLALLFPAMLFSWKARRSSHRTWRCAVPIAWAVFAAAALLTSSGCASATYSVAAPGASPATYQYRITAASVDAAVPVSQAVVLNLTVDP